MPFRNSQPPRVLLADDDASHSALVSRRLRRDGFECASVQTGLDAIARLDAGETFDVVVLDMNMPGLDGMDTLTAIRDRGDPPPVVFVTGADETALAVAGLKAGASDYIVKSTDPIYFDLLATALRAAISNDRERKARLKAEEARDLLTREMAHRVKNILSVISSVATLSGRSAADLKSFLKDFQGRIAALAAAHDRLIHEDWRQANLQGIVEAVLASQADPRLSIDVPRVRIDPQLAHTLALVVHELATNAVKYGALQHPDGRVSLTGQVLGAAGERVRLNWNETGFKLGAPPTRRGFGLTMIERAMAQGGGVVKVEWRPSGLACTLDLPLVGSDETSAMSLH